MAEWYFAGEARPVGPLDDAAARAYARAHPEALCWRRDFGDWRPAGDVAELDTRHGRPSAAMVRPWSTTPAARVRADAIDFRIGGAETQYVEIALDPGESAIAEAGAMMYKDPGIAMTTIFGDGSGQDDGLIGRLIGAGRRVLTGEGLFSTVFTHEGQGKARVAFAAPYPGHILALRLTEVGGRLICQKDAFLAAAKGVEIGLHFQDRVLAGLFGGEGFVMQRLDGDGWVFVHIGGAVVERTLGPEDTLEVDTGCLAAMTATVGFDVVRAGGVKTMLFGGEGLFLARLSGPGRVWLQSLPISRLAGRLHALAPDHGGRRREEGSLLGGIGDLVGGDRRF